MSRAFVALTFLLTGLTACGPATAQKTSPIFGAGAAQGGDREAGATLFRENCASCHGATGVEGGPLCPSLRHESARMGFGTTVSWIEDPEPPMPALYPQKLNETQVRDLAAFVQSL